MISVIRGELHRAQTSRYRWKVILASETIRLAVGALSLDRRAMKLAGCGVALACVNIVRAIAHERHFSQVLRDLEGVEVEGAV